MHLNVQTDGGRKADTGLEYCTTALCLEYTFPLFEQQRRVNIAMCLMLWPKLTNAPVKECISTGDNGRPTHTYTGMINKTKHAYKSRVIIHIVFAQQDSFLGANAYT